MNTKCYCLGCKRHPKHDKRNQFKKWFTGFEPGFVIIAKQFEDQGSFVNCLKVESEADEFVDLNDFDYPITAYGDGCAVTGSETQGLTIYANCGNEDHED